MQITEPSTMLTDYILALFTLVLALRLFKEKKNNDNSSIQLWAGALTATVIAAFLGGTSHGFSLHLSQFAQTAIWKGTVYSIGIASLLMLSGTIVASVRSPLKKWLLYLTAIKFLVYAVWMVNHDDFIFVIYDYAPAMLGVILLQSFAYFKRKEPSAVWLISGVIVSFAGAGVQLSGFSLHEHFNFNDIYHVIQMGANYLLYRGARLLKDQLSIIPPRGGN